MDKPISTAQILEEISLIPRDKLTELYNLIHTFRTQTTTLENNNDIMQFAGAWEEMITEDFDNFLQDIEARRQTSNTRRFTDENLFT